MIWEWGDTDMTEEAMPRKRGKTMGDMTPAERDAITREAVAKLQAQLDSAAPILGAVLAADGPLGVHDYEPGDITHKMHTDPLCAACGLPRRTGRHHGN